MERTVVFIGDSFVEGVGDTDQGGWTKRLEVEREGWIGIHKGIGGDNVRSILNRFSTDAISFNPDIVVVEVGANDSRIRPSLGGLNEVPPREFSAALRTLGLIVRAKKIQHLILIGLTPVDETKTKPYKEDKIYLNREIRKFDKMIRKFALSQGHMYVSLYNEFLAGGPSRLTVDGVHPSPEGHAMIARIVNGLFSPAFRTSDRIER